MKLVLVVHCVDAEGPLGGDARRNDDGTPEFFDTWPAILASLNDLTTPKSRDKRQDSYGNPWVFSWFTLDFQGFATNPKCRDTTPHCVYDKLGTLDTSGDGFYFHHHAVPESGAGDEWADEWNPEPAEEQLDRMWRERGRRPFVFRAGGTIENNDLSHWLDDEGFTVDFSNRVSERSRPDSGLYDFSWFGAPSRWGSYQPSWDNFLEPGGAGRHVYRCIDLRSRYNELTDAHVDEAFTQTNAENRPAVLSFFSHDNRDMRSETKHAYKLIAAGAKRHGIPWRISTAVGAHRIYQDAQLAVAA